MVGDVMIEDSAVPYWVLLINWTANVNFFQI